MGSLLSSRTLQKAINIQIPKQDISRLPYPNKMVKMNASLFIAGGSLAL